MNPELIVHFVGLFIYFFCLHYWKCTAQKTKRIILFLNATAGAILISFSAVSSRKSTSSFEALKS